MQFEMINESSDSQEQQVILEMQQQHVSLQQQQQQQLSIPSSQRSTEIEIEQTQSSLVTAENSSEQQQVYHRADSSEVTSSRCFEEYLRTLSESERETTLDESILLSTFKLKNTPHTLDLHAIQKIYRSFQSRGKAAAHNEKRMKKNWSDDETYLLLWLSETMGVRDAFDPAEFSECVWVEIAKMIPHKAPDNCKLRWLYLKKHSVSALPWTPEEDQRLAAIINVKGLCNNKWNEIAKELYESSAVVGGSFRKGKQCRERWNNHLDPEMKRGHWTIAEDIKLLEMALAHRNKWSFIAKELKERTENAVKNRFKSLIRKYDKAKKSSASAQLKNQNKAIPLNESTSECPNKNIQSLDQQDPLSPCSDEDNKLKAIIESLRLKADSAGYNSQNDADAEPEDNEDQIEHENDELEGNNQEQVNQSKIEVEDSNEQQVHIKKTSKKSKGKPSKTKRKYSCNNLQQTPFSEGTPLNEHSSNLSCNSMSCEITFIENEQLNVPKEKSGLIPSCNESIDSKFQTAKNPLKAPPLPSTKKSKKTQRNEKNKQQQQTDMSPFKDTSDFLKSREQDNSNNNNISQTMNGMLTTTPITSSSATAASSTSAFSLPSFNALPSNEVASPLLSTQQSHSIFQPLSSFFPSIPLLQPLQPIIQLQAFSEQHQQLLPRLAAPPIYGLSRSSIIPSTSSLAATAASSSQPIKRGSVFSDMSSADSTGCRGSSGCENLGSFILFDNQAMNPTPTSNQIDTSFVSSMSSFCCRSPISQTNNNHTGTTGSDYFKGIKGFSPSSATSTGVGQSLISQLSNLALDSSVGTSASTPSAKRRNTFATSMSRFESLQKHVKLQMSGCPVSLQQQNQQSQQEDIQHLLQDVHSSLIKKTKKNLIIFDGTHISDKHGMSENANTMTQIQGMNSQNLEERIADGFTASSMMKCNVDKIQSEINKQCAVNVSTVGSPSLCATQDEHDIFGTLKYSGSQKSAFKQFSSPAMFPSPASISFSSLISSQSSLLNGHIAAAAAASAQAAAAILEDD